MRRALVTGGTKGLGLAAARALAGDGLDVLATFARDEDAARAAADEAARGGLRLAVERCDVTDAAAVERLFERERDRGFDVLVHAAGFTRDKLMMLMPERDFDDVIAVHLKGAFLAGRQAMRAMIARRWGRIVLLVSPTALLGRNGQTNYGAAKAGVIGLARARGAARGDRGGGALVVLRRRGVRHGTGAVRRRWTELAGPRIGTRLSVFWK